MSLSVKSVVLLSFLAAGCHAPPPEDPRVRLGSAKIIETGDPAKNHPNPADLRLSLLDSKSPMKRGGEVPIECIVIVSSDDALPQQVQVDVSDKKNRICSSGIFTKKSDLGGGQTRLEGQLSLPDKPGRYDVQVTAVDTVFRIGTKTLKAAQSSRTTFSNKVEVQIR